MNYVLCVFMREDSLKSSLLVAIKVEAPFLIGNVLDDFARDYGIGRKNLFGIVVTVIDINKRGPSDDRK